MRHYKTLNLENVKEDLISLNFYEYQIKGDDRFLNLSDIIEMLMEEDEVRVSRVAFSDAGYHQFCKGINDIKKDRSFRNGFYYPTKILSENDYYIPTLTPYEMGKLWGLAFLEI